MENKNKVYGLIPKSVDEIRKINAKRKLVAFFENKHKTTLSEIELTRTKEISTYMDAGFTQQEIKDLGLYTKAQLAKLEELQG